MVLKNILLSIYIVSAFATNCFTPTDISNSDKLFSYKGKVYDSTGYNHPGGKNDIKKLIGNDLEDFVDSNSESFHLNSSKFYSDLDDEQMLINSCHFNKWMGQLGTADILMDWSN